MALAASHSTESPKRQAIGCGLVPCSAQQHFRASRQHALTALLLTPDHHFFRDDVVKMMLAANESTEVIGYLAAPLPLGAKPAQVSDLCGSSTRMRQPADPRDPLQGIDSKENFNPPRTSQAGESPFGRVSIAFAESDCQLWN
jgi:hypothetical protein